MITNIRLDFDDDQRRQIASLLAGKPVKRLATRQEIVGFVKDAIAVELSARRHESMPATKADRRRAERDEVNENLHRQIAGGRTVADEVLHRVRNRDMDEVPEFCGNDCCRRNDLLQSRVNVLQHRLDARMRGR